MNHFGCGMTGKDDGAAPFHIARNSLMGDNSHLKVHTQTSTQHGICMTLMKMAT